MHSPAPRSGCPRRDRGRVLGKHGCVAGWGVSDELPVAGMEQCAVGTAKPRFHCTRWPAARCAQLSGLSSKCVGPTHWTAHCKNGAAMGIEAAARTFTLHGVEREASEATKAVICSSCAHARTAQLVDWPCSCCFVYLVAGYRTRIRLRHATARRKCADLCRQGCAC